MRDFFETVASRGLSCVSNCALTVREGLHDETRDTEVRSRERRAAVIYLFDDANTIVTMRVVAM